MSGGSMNYIYINVKEAATCFRDPQIRELIKDISELMHDKEWADSGDYSDGEYNKTEAEFKKKWFANKTETTADLINDEIEGLRTVLLNCIGIHRYCKDCKHWKKEKDGDYGRCKDDKWLTHGYEYGYKEWSDD